MKTIVIGYDETDPAERALGRTIELAKGFGVSLVVTSIAPVVAGGPRSMGVLDPTDTLAEHRDELDHACATVEAAGLTAEYIAGVGDPADAIVDLAESAAPT
jgi:nucleotide-binding universal stress UspA family protein